MDNPIRHNNHLLEKESEQFFRNNIPNQWIVDKPTDYGIDLKVDIVTKNRVTGYNFSTQLKSKEKFKNKGKNESIKLKRRTINYYLNRLEPILVVCYIRENKEAYWKWFDKKEVNLTKSQTSYSIKIPKSNILTEIDWNNIESQVLKIFSRKHLLEDFPEINFSKINNDIENEAWSKFVNKEFNEAISKFLAHIKSDSKSAISHQGLALCYYNLYHYKEALISINKALKLSENDFRYEIIKASILAEYGSSTNDMTKLLQAEKIFGKAVENENSETNNYNYANTLYGLKKIEKSKFHYKCCLSINPNNAQAWKNLGQIYYDLRQHEEEIKCYDKAIKINSNLCQALTSKGITLVQVYKNYKEALKLFERAHKANPNFIYEFNHAFFWFSFLYDKLGNEKKSIEYLNEGLELYPNDRYLLNRKWDYYEENWSKSEDIRHDALEFCQLRLQVLENDGSAYFLKAIIALGEGDKVAAFNFLKFIPFVLNLNVSDFEEYNLELSDYLYILKYAPYYLTYRAIYDIRLYSEILKASEIQPNPAFMELLNLSFGIVFGKISEFYSKNLYEDNIEEKIVEYTYNFSNETIPKIAPLLVEESKDNLDLFIKEITKIILVMPNICLLDVTKILAYLSEKIGLNHELIKEKLEAKMDDKWAIKLLIKSMEFINNKYELLRKD